MAKPLRVAIVGSGPAGMYAAGHLLERMGGAYIDGRLERLADGNVEVDVLDRLPTPWGLIRGGVAPDHPEKKLMAQLYDAIARRPGFRFFGNVEVGRDITAGNLSEWYDAVVYAFGAEGERSLGLPGEQLPGSLPARHLVAWYNGHPDFAELAPPLDSERAVLIGNGNVAMDVARILLKPVDELTHTDIAQHALDALAESRIREVLILGRRGPENAAYNFPELAELGDLPDVSIHVTGATLDQAGQAPDHETALKLKTLRRLCEEKTDGRRRLEFRFHTSPVALIGAERVESVRVAGRSSANAEPVEEDIATGLVVAAIGYRGQAMPGLPFDEPRGVIPSESHRVMNGATVLVGNYVTGWIRRGPQGVIGSNKKCARNCVIALMEDARAGRLNRDQTLSADEAAARIRAARAGAVDFQGWRCIDRSEREAGSRSGRPRLKLARSQDLLAAAKR